MTAIKPVLEAVDTDWVANVDRWSVSCSRISNRQDNTHKHLLCTVLHLAITDNDLPGASQPYKVTVHFYHTKDKIQVQSTGILSPGNGAASWFVKNIIEPMAADHVAANYQSIQEVNNAIISAASPASWSCNHCHSDIDPRATQVRERPLACNTCLKMFHKKCTNRSGARGNNWSRDPWLCPACSTSRETTPPLPSLSMSSVATSTQETTALPAITTEDARQEDNSVIETGLASAVPPSTSSSSSLVATAQSLLAIQPGQFQSQQQHQPKFPSNNIRQRKSNIPVNEPEKEFQKVALDACRSTIIQQEAELKRLNECLDIRNKKIMQLESQVGVATTYLSSRDSSPQASSPAMADHLNALSSSLALLISKLSLLTDTPAKSTPTVNIYNSHGNHARPHMNDKATQSPQIPNSSSTSDLISNDANEVLNDVTASIIAENPNVEIVLTCTVCNKALESSDQLDLHMESLHGSDPHNEGNVNLPTSVLLNRHHSAIHPHLPDYKQCSSCMFRCQNNDQLDLHIRASHGPPPGDPSVSQQAVSASQAQSPAALDSMSL